MNVSYTVTWAATYNHAYYSGIIHHLPYCHNHFAWSLCYFTFLWEITLKSHTFFKRTIQQDSIPNDVSIPPTSEVRAATIIFLSVAGMWTWSQMEWLRFKSLWRWYILVYVDVSTSICLYEELYHVGYNAVYYTENKPTFRRNIPLLPSILKYKPSKISACIRHQACYLLRNFFFWIH
jgi:hypothetical protein